MALRLSYGGVNGVSRVCILLDYFCCVEENKMYLLAENSVFNYLLIGKIE